MFETTLQSINLALKEGIKTDVEFTQKTFINMGKMLTVSVIIILMVYFLLKTSFGALNKG